MIVAAHAPDRRCKKVSHLSKHDLNARRSGLLELMQCVNFGWIEDLTVLNGDPVLDPPPRLMREVKFGADNGPRPQLAADNFFLMTQVVELAPHFYRLAAR